MSSITSAINPILPTPSDVVPSPIPTSDDPSRYQNPPASVGLYLYTFIAILIMIIFVSFFFSLRSAIVRRQQRRLIEEGIRNGTWPPPAPAKPAFFVASVSGGGTGEKKKEGDWQIWGFVIPVAAAYLAAPSCTLTPNPAASTPLQRYLSVLPPRFTLSAPSSQSTTPQPLSQPQPTSSPSSLTPTHTEMDQTMVQVTFLIAMPSLSAKYQYRRLSQDSEREHEDVLPHLEFGVAEVKVVESALGQGE